MAEITHEEMLDDLLTKVKPGSRRYQRLKRMRDKIDRRVMLGGGDISYLLDIRQKMTLPECEYLGIHGECGIGYRRHCDAAPEWKEGRRGCAKYAKMKPDVGGRYRDPFEPVER